MVLNMWVPLCDHHGADVKDNQRRHHPLTIIQQQSSRAMPKHEVHSEESLFSGSAMAFFYGRRNQKM